MVAGPGFGAVLLLLGSQSAAFLINGVTFALSAVVVASLPADEHFAPGRAESQTSGLWAELRTGAAALHARPEAVRLIGADVMCSIVYGAHSVLLLLAGPPLRVAGPDRRAPWADEDCPDEDCPDELCQTGRCPTGAVAGLTLPMSSRICHGGLLPR